MLDAMAFAQEVSIVQMEVKLWFEQREEQVWYSQRKRKLGRSDERFLIKVKGRKIIRFEWEKNVEKLAQKAINEEEVDLKYSLDITL